jgi:hypothetical protein
MKRAPSHERISRAAEIDTVALHDPVDRMLLSQCFCVNAEAIGTPHEKGPTPERILDIQCLPLHASPAFRPRAAGGRAEGGGGIEMDASARLPRVVRPRWVDACGNT